MPDTSHDAGEPDRAEEIRRVEIARRERRRRRRWIVAVWVFPVAPVLIVMLFWFGWPALVLVIPMLWMTWDYSRKGDLQAPLRDFSMGN